MRLIYDLDYSTIRYVGEAGFMFSPKGYTFFDHAGKRVIFTQDMGRTSFASKGGIYPFDFHQGNDFSSDPKGMPLVAPEDGVITNLSFSNATTGFGNFVDLRGVETGYSHRIAHMNKVVVKQGQRVTKGELIGYEGTTGFVRPVGAYHAHWDISRLNRRYSSSELSSTDYKNQFVRPLELVLRDFEKEIEINNKMTEEDKKFMKSLIDPIPERIGELDTNLKHMLETNTKKMWKLLDFVYKVCYGSSRTLDPAGAESWLDSRKSFEDVIVGIRYSKEYLQVWGQNVIEGTDPLSVILGGSKDGQKTD
jgi:hypothetical protein